MNDVVREFLLETNENLAQLDSDLVTLEKEPTERETLARVFRTLHTVKGTAGFLGLPKLQAISHAAENLLSRLRAGELVFHAEIATALLAVVDAIRRVLVVLEKSETEGDGDYGALIQSLERLTPGSGTRPPAVPISPTLVVPPLRPFASRPVPAESAPVVHRSVSNPDRDASTAIQAADSEPAEPAEPRAPAVSESAIRVDVGLLDKLMTLVGELVLARNHIMQFSASEEDPAFLATVQRLNLLTTELQTNVMKTRMQPIGNVWGKFPRVVRDLAIACGKQIRLDMVGQETELDKTILEAIRDPLTHLVRNAVDHGIETSAERTARGKPLVGRISLHAFHEGGKVIIEMTDDGQGIDPSRVRDKAIAMNLIPPDQAARMGEREIVNLIFQPGFSTAAQVTNFSGRGVGMDVVRTNIEKIGGTVDVESRIGQGTTIKMKIPLTLAIIPALTVKSGGDRYAIPQVSLLELVRLVGEQARKRIEQIHGAPVYRLRGNLLPVVYLSEQLQVESKADKSTLNIVVLQADDRQFGLVVDDIHDSEEIVVKPLQKQLRVGVFAGATIMGDGKVALILDILGLAQRANVVSEVRERGIVAKANASGVISGDRQTILVCSMRDGGRIGIPLSLVARLEEFPQSAVERTGPKLVVQYRDDIMPLIDVAEALGQGDRISTGTTRMQHEKTAMDSTTGSIQVVVYALPKGYVGLVVGNIVDILEQAVVIRARAKRPGVLYAAVIQGRVTEFIDIEAIVRAVDPDLFHQVSGV